MIVYSLIRAKISKMKYMNQITAITFMSFITILFMKLFYGVNVKKIDGIKKCDFARTCALSYYHTTFLRSRIRTTVANGFRL